MGRTHLKGASKGIILWLCCLSLIGLNAKATTVNAVFSGSVTLDGDISDFFEADGTTPKAGVLTADDPAGLNEAPLAAASSFDNVLRPSGFNQRRIMSAYNPTVNGGTIFIGIDLPGGTGSTANPDYADGVVPVRGSIKPFDADGNGEADTIGRLSGGGNLYRCPGGAGDTIDILNCGAASAAGASDNPRTASGEVAGMKENYVATVYFGNGNNVTVEFFEDGNTAAGVAKMTVSSDPVAPFGAKVSSATGGEGSVLGTDVEIAITNVNAAVGNACAVLSQTVIIDSGSNRDGSGQGEDNNLLVATYELPSTVACEVAFLTNSTVVVGNGCANPVQGAVGVEIGDTVTVSVTVCAGSGNAQGVKNISINVPTIGAVLIPGPLAAGACVSTNVGSFACAQPGVSAVSATISAEGVITSNCVPIQTSCQASVQCCGEPCIKVTKLIACMPASTDCLAATGYAESATGYKSATENPAFCYKITVENCGSLVLTNVTVVDNVLGDLGSLFSDTLAVSASETAYVSMAHSNNTQNTVNATGQSVAGPVNSQDTADAFVIPASILCDATATSPDDQDGNTGDNHVTLPKDGADHLVQFCVTLTAGNAPLQNIMVSNSAVSCDVGPFSLAANTSTTLCCEVSINCSNLVNGVLSNNVSVTAEVADCGLNGNGERITVSTTCGQVVECRGGDCITRTPGYWFNHPQSDDPNCATLLKAIEANGGKLDLGFMCLPTGVDQNGDQVVDAKDALREAYSFFPPKGKGNTLCGARVKLAFHLIAAIANSALLGTDPGNCNGQAGLLPSNLIAQAQAAGACDDIQAINQVKSLLDQFNNSGDGYDFPEPLKPCGLAGGKARKALKPSTAVFTTGNCANTNNCAAGHACP